jgi:NAD(P)-dependent dehydrogenase (short-subunit alcohol dehydrogenase family)
MEEDYAAPFGTATVLPDDHDRAALVTGGASGIGYAVATRFGRAGSRVLIADIDDQQGHLAVEALVAGGIDATFVTTDVSSEPDVENMIALARDRFGSLDWVCHSAGIGGGGKGIGAQCRAGWDEILAVNLTGVWLCLKHELALLRSGAAVVNVASVVGLVGLANSSAYVAAKHGVIGLTRTAALELADADVRVNAVCPGAINTPLLRRRLEREPERKELLLSRQAMRRLGTPDEVADAVMWLCRGAGFVTGQAIAIDGGWTAR